MTGTPRQPIVMVSSRRADSTARQSVKGTESIDTTSCSEFVLVNEATQDFAAVEDRDGASLLAGGDYRQPDADGDERE